MSPEVHQIIDGFADSIWLGSKVIEDSEVVVVGRDFLISFCSDRDGVSAKFVDCVSQKTYGLDLFLFEVRKARVSPVAPADMGRGRDVLEVGQLIKMLVGFGQDLLKGDRLWTKEYPWAPLPLIANEKVKYALWCRKYE